MLYLGQADPEPILAVSVPKCSGTPTTVCDMRESILERNLTVVRSVANHSLLQMDSNLTRLYI